MFVPVLVVEDDGTAAAAISAALSQSGFCPVVAPSAHHVVVLARHLAPHLVVLGLALREADGLRVLAALRHNGYNDPILALAGEREAAAAARQAGADDVLVGPVVMADLVARARALSSHEVPRAAPTAPAAPAASAPVVRRDGDRLDFDDLRFVFDDFVVVAGARTITRAGRPVALGALELDLLLALLRRRGAVATRRELVREVWGIAAPADPRLVDRHIMELRRRIEPDPAVPRYVLTVWKVGYRFRSPDEERTPRRQVELAHER